MNVYFSLQRKVKTSAVVEWDTMSKPPLAIVPLYTTKWYDRVLVTSKYSVSREPMVEGERCGLQSRKNYTWVISRDDCNIIFRSWLQKCMNCVERFACMGEFRTTKVQLGRICETWSWIKCRSPWLTVVHSEKMKGTIYSWGHTKILSNGSVCGVMF